MSIPDKVAAAKKINEFLQAVVTHGGLRFKYRIVVDPPLPENRDWEKPEILVDFSGPDSALLLDRGGELLRALELLALEMLRLPSGEHEKISFDCQNQRSLRIQELQDGRDRRRREGAEDGDSVPVQSDVVARAADRPPGAARRGRPADRERGRRDAAVSGGVSQGLQGRGETGAANAALVPLSPRFWLFAFGFATEIRAGVPLLPVWFVRGATFQSALWNSTLFRIPLADDWRPGCILSPLGSWGSTFHDSLDQDREK